MDNIEKLEPRAFTRFCMSIGAVPSSYIAGLSIEEQLLWFCSYLENEVIPAVNNNGEAVEELQNLYIQLQDYVDHYFDNLDVQEEINTKLDEMVEDGTFDTIINQELFGQLNTQINNLQTQQGQMQNSINGISTSLSNNIAKTNNNETKIGNLQDTKANESTLFEFMNATNTALNNQYEMIGRLQGGTPEVVSDVSDMTDTSKIYVLTTDGKWYYYNGANWVAGGTYQATEFSEDSIDNLAIKRLDFSKTRCVPLIEELGTTAWNNATVPWHSKNNIQIRFQQSSGNAGIYIVDLNSTDVDLTRDTIWNAQASGVLFSIYLFNNNSFVKTVYTAYDEGTNKNFLFRLKASDLSGLANPRILVASSHTGDVFISNLTVTYYNNYEYREHNLISKINEIGATYENLKDDTMQTDLCYWTNQYFGTQCELFAHGLDSFTINHTGDDGTSNSSRGVCSSQLTRTDKKLIIEGDIENVSQPYLSFTVYIAKGNTSGVDFVGVGGADNVDANGHLKIAIDMPYYSVYEGYTNYYVWIMLDRSGMLNVTNFKFYYSDISELSIYRDNFNDMVKTIDSKITTTSSVKNEVTYMNAPTKKYFLQVNDSGTLQTINVIPSKTLFVGNSLLLGNHHGDYAFGMCATDINHDYYHYITDYILDRNAQATFEKLEGTTFEAATNQTTVTNYLNNTLLPKLSNDLELVMVQLGDNVNTEAKITTFTYSCLQLLQFIRQHAPNARVVFVGEWYATTQRQTIIANACKSTGCQFVDISALNTEENQASIGDVITYPDGYTETVSTSGVASHPGNTGFEAISNKIISEIF